jgi:AcrR family transcriptional regulator
VAWEFLQSLSGVAVIERARAATYHRVPKKKNDRSFCWLEYYDRSCYCQYMAKTFFSPTVGLENADHSPSKGQASRENILRAAAKLATTKGLDGLSIGDLAAEVGMSKSGLYAHFKSKEDLELATIEMAATIFEREVLRPVPAAPTGSKKLLALVNSFLDYLKRQIFPGGCFFAAVGMELDTRPGPARDKVIAVQQQWLSLLRQCFLDAKANGEVDDGTEIEQAVFETHAMLLAANFLFVMSNDTTKLKQARRGVDHVLARLAIRGEPKRKRSVRVARR